MNETVNLQEQQAQQLVLLATKAEVALVWAESEEPVASPCINVCRLTEDRGHCQGCFRTVDEIRAWSRAGGQERRQIWRNLLRRADIEQALIPRLQA